MMKNEYNDNSQNQNEKLLMNLIKMLKSEKKEIDIDFRKHSIPMKDMQSR